MERAHRSAQLKVSIRTRVLRETIKTMIESRVLLSRENRFIRSIQETGKQNRYCRPLALRSAMIRSINAACTCTSISNSDHAPDFNSIRASTCLGSLLVSSIIHFPLHQSLVHLMFDFTSTRFSFKAPMERTGLRFYMRCFQRPISTRSPTDT